MTALVTGLPEVLLRRLLQLLENHRGDFRRRVFLVTGLHAHVTVGRRDDGVGHHLHFLGDLGVTASHEALDREDGVLRVGDRLALRHLADEPLARLGESHDRRRQSTALWVGDDNGLAALHDGDNGVGGAQVDTDDFAHVSRVLFADRFSLHSLLNLSVALSISAVTNPCTNLR